MARKGSERTKKKETCCSLVFIDSARVLKRSLVMPLPKDTNLLDQVCRNIDWEEAERRHCAVFSGELVCETGLLEVRQPVKGCPSLSGANTKGRGPGDVIEMLKTRGEDTLQHHLTPNHMQICSQLNCMFDGYRHPGGFVFSHKRYSRGTGLLTLRRKCHTLMILNGAILFSIHPACVYSH